MLKTLIVDYGMGDIDSVTRAVAECGRRPVVSSHRGDLETAIHIIQPGVGSYHVAMNNLRILGLVDALKAQVLAHRIPFLGLCLGMQLLSLCGHEVRETGCLDLIPGEVTALKVKQDSRLRIPHVGWNEDHFQRFSAVRRSSFGKGLLRRAQLLLPLREPVERAGDHCPRQ